MGNPMGTRKWLAGFKEDYDKVFVKEWSPYLGAILLVVVIFALMVNGMVWGVFGGVKFWGDWFNNLIGLGPVIGVPKTTHGFLTHRMSLMNIMLVVGAFSAALLSRQFNPNLAPKLEYVWGALGGTLLGLGASLAGGCTTGGFFNPVVHASPAGWAMWLGLLGGAAIGLKMLLWTMENVDWGTAPPPTLTLPTSTKARLPWLAMLVMLGVVFWSGQWFGSGDPQFAALAVIVVAGFLIGFVMHRSRMCFSRAFREPFLTAEGKMTKAVILALAVSMPIAALLFEKKVIDPYTAIPATFWIGSLLGGLIFGIGMVFAGGCASGSLWRMGEGHLKLWVTMFFFAWSGSIASALLKKLGLTAVDAESDLAYEVTPLGMQAYFPDMLGSWNFTLLISGGLLLLWYALVRYNESTEKFTLM
ncbi:MAG: YeeE/YedE family protein [Rhodoferax sp.]|nr:YeeE/YedE family protein [Rhodoferax sp.]